VGTSGDLICSGTEANGLTCRWIQPADGDRIVFCKLKVRSEYTCGGGGAVNTKRLTVLSLQNKKQKSEYPISRQICHAYMPHSSVPFLTYRDIAK
jgi:hypothetical protein